MKGSVKGKKVGPLEWGNSQHQAWSQLMSAFCTAPLLRYFDPSLRLRLETDASDLGLGAVLTQLFEGQWHPIAFWSRQLTPPERNYETHD